jgi:hypothetical protein
MVAYGDTICIFDFVLHGIMEFERKIKSQSIVFVVCKQSGV